MAEILLTKALNGALQAADEGSLGLLAKIKTGELVRAEIKRVRNPRFHRKAFALFKLAYDHWEPSKGLEYKGQPVAKDFDRFRKELLILAGFYKAVYSTNGEIRLEAQSISFGAMDDARFEKVYRAVLDVVWRKILTTYKDAADIDRVVEQLLGFE